MFRFVPRFAAVLVLVVAGTLAPAAAEERSFYASGAGNVQVDDYSAVMYAGFEATHLGNASFYGSVYSLYYSQPLEIHVELDAANGDRLYLDGVVDYNYDTGIAIGTLTITGGTGASRRFQDATGSADVMFVFDLNVQKFTFLIDGSIDY